MSTLIPAAQYVRASTERQQYSIEYQCMVISQYAKQKGFEIIRTFSDEARSGVDLRHRPALKRLLEEVVRGETPYRSILVFDVSRWGRFQDTDEAAHYEFLCKSAGIPIHYCAEPFSNDGAIADSLLKTLKRFMAGEYSRDLSARTLNGVRQLVQRGFKYGSTPGYGLRRMLVSSDGSPKQLLGAGECKSVSTDRVVLVPGPTEERGWVKEIYRLFVEERWPMTRIARELNQRSVPFTPGRNWSPTVVKRILSHPKYTGDLVFNRTEKKLQSALRRTQPSQWVVKERAFEPIIDRPTFEAAQRVFSNMTRKKTNRQLLDDLGRLWAEKGTINLKLVRESPGIASPQTYITRFGSLCRAYRLIGYEVAPGMRFRQFLVSLRNSLAQQLVNLFPGRVQKSDGRVKHLQLKDGPEVVIHVCRSHKLQRGQRWIMRTACHKRPIALLAMMNEENSKIETFYVVPCLPKGERWIHPGDDLLEGSIRLNSLSEFDFAVRTIETSGVRAQAHF